MVSDYYKLTLKKSEDVANNIRRFIFEPNENFEYNPGNYAQFFISKNPNVSGMSRPFTMASKPGEDHLMFIIKKVGTFTTELFKLEEGDVVDIEAPLGNMYYDKENHQGKKIIFIAGGTGITPFLCMHDFFKSNDMDPDIRLFYSVSDENEIIEKERIEKLDSKILVSSKEGRIDEEFLNDNLSDEELENAVIFVCGPPKMEKGLDETLKKMGAKTVIRETA